MNQQFFYQQRLPMLFLLAIIFMSVSCSPTKEFLLAGTYTNTGSKGIYVCTFDHADGKIEMVSHTDSVVNPTFLVVSGDKNFVYAVNETGGETPGSVSAFSFDKKEGKLHFLNKELSGGDSPCHLELSKDGKWLAVANYTGGSLSMFPVADDGRLQPYTQLISHSGSSIDTSRQDKPYVHETVFSPDGKYLLATDLGIDKVMIYRFNPSAKEPLTPADPPYVSTTPGSGPRHTTFHPNGKFAYVITELSGFVIAYDYNDGKLTEIQNISAHPKDFKGEIGSAEIYTSPDGKFLYASNRGDENSIAIFSIDQATGKLTLAGHQPVGKAPRHFMIDPSGKYLIVANQDSDSVVVYKIDQQTGLLAAAGEEISLPRPVCLQLVPAK